MMNKKFFIAMLALALAGVFAFSSFGFAGDIKQRMKARHPQIKALKAKGIVGENNKGFLEFRGASTEGQNIVNAENADRGTVYGVIAKQQRVAPAVVGERRAAKIAQKAKSGEWIQNADGKWIKK